MPTARRILATVPSAAAVLALAAPAHGATIATSECVRSTTPASDSLPISGTGYTPRATVTVFFTVRAGQTPAFLTSTVAGADGAIETRARPPLFRNLATQQQSFSLIAEDETDPAIVATTTFDQIRAGYTTVPRRGSVTDIVRHTVRGLPSGRNTYLHFRFRGVTRRTVLLGRSTGPCGIVSRRMARLPTKSLPGAWTVFADQSRAYRPSTRPQLRSAFRITRAAR